MGGMLTQPVTDKSSHKGEGLGLRYGLSSMQGWRPEMEDAHDIKIGLRYGLDDWCFFAVFDGHAGKCAAAYAAWNLLECILRDKQFELGTGELKCTTPADTDLYDAPNVENITKQPSNEVNGDETSSTINIEKAKSGDQPLESDPLWKSEQKDPSTSHDQLNKEAKSEVDDEAPKPKFGTFPVYKQLEMVQSAIKSGFLNMDQSMRKAAQDMSGCTAVCTLLSPTHLFIANCGDSRAVLFDGTPKFVTEDHKPFNPKERKRIIEAGGTATQRVNGTLAVSRALGDFEFKKDVLRGPCEQLVSPEPEVTVIERSLEDEFLILACDGIWDVMTNDELCQFVKYRLSIEPDLENICSSVLDVCLRKGSRDNMSIILVVFGTESKVQQEEVERDKKNDEILLEFAESYLERANVSIFPAFIASLNSELEERCLTILPPGGGIEAKYNLLREKFECLFEKADEKDE